MTFQFFGRDVSYFVVEISVQILFLKICFRFPWKTLSFNKSLVEVSSEICLVGISLQRMVEISLQTFLREIILFMFLLGARRVPDHRGAKPNRGQCSVELGFLEGMTGTQGCPNVYACHETAK